MSAMGKFWFLDLAVYFTPPIGVILSNPKAFEEFFWGIHYHELSREDVLMKLLEMQRLRLIDIVYHDCQINPNLLELQRIADDEKRPPFSLYYRLTNEGGKEWEKLARPDWERFWLDTYPNDSKVDFECYSKSRWLFIKREVEEYLRIELRESRVTYELTLSPWRPTYWKQLPSGYRISYVYTEHDHVTDKLPSRDVRIWTEYGFQFARSKRAFRTSRRQPPDWEP